MSGLSTDGFCFQKTFAPVSHLMLCMKSQLATNKEYIQNGYQMFDFRRISSILHIYSSRTQEAKFFALGSKHDNYILVVVWLASAQKWVPKITFRIEEMLASDTSCDIIIRYTNKQMGIVTCAAEIENKKWYIFGTILSTHHTWHYSFNSWVRASGCQILFLIIIFIVTESLYDKRKWFIVTLLSYIDYCWKMLFVLYFLKRWLNAKTLSTRKRMRDLRVGFRNLVKIISKPTFFVFNWRPSHLPLCMKLQLATIKEYTPNRYHKICIIIDSSNFKITNSKIFFTKFLSLRSKHGNYSCRCSTREWVPKIIFCFQEMLPSDTSYGMK